MQYFLRPSTPEDFEFVYQLNEQAMRPYIEPLRGWDAAAERQDVQQWFHPGQDQIIVIQGKDAGILAIEQRPAALHLRLLELLPAYQKQGIGTAVISDLLRQAQTANLTVTLGVLKHNPARRLYERLGFVVTGETEIKYRMSAHPSPQP